MRLLDLGLFRVGGERYAAANDTFGVATVRHEHLRITDVGVVCDYTAKGGQRRVSTGETSSRSGSEFGDGG